MEGCRPAGGETAGGERRGGQSQERLARGWVLAARSDDRPLERERLAGLDELSAYGPQRRVGNGGPSPGSEPSKSSRRRPEERVVREAAVELARVVVECEDEACALERWLARGANENAPAGELHRLGAFSARERALPARLSGGEPE
jgi:hypothetical protein